MMIRLSKLYDNIRECEAIYIYGAGYFAEILLEAIKFLGQEHKIKAFIVSNGRKKEKIEKFNIIELHELLFQKNELVVIGVSYKYELEIKNNLETLGVDFIEFSKILQETVKDSLLELRNSNEKELCNILTDYYIYRSLPHHAIDFDKVFNVEFQRINELIKGHAEKKKEENYIVFIVGTFTARSARIIKAINRIGWKTKVLQYRYPGYVNYAGDDELIGTDIVVEKCTSLEEILYLALMEHPLAYYIQSPNADASIAEIMLRHKNIYGKIIFSAYDVCHGTYYQKPRHYYETERYALENADGIVWRYYSKDYIEKMFNINYHGKHIHFLDYCDNLTVCENLDDRTDRLLKICSLPTHLIELLDKGINEKYIHEVSANLVLKKLESSGIDYCFHIYTRRIEDNQTEEISRLERKYSGFKCFIGVEHKELMERLKEYDYLFLIYSNDPIPDWPNGERGYTEGTYKYSVCNKYFEAISAGVPVVATSPIEQCKFLKNLGCLIDMSINTLDGKMLVRNKKIYKSNVIRAREGLLIDNNIKRLISFIREISI